VAGKWFFLLNQGMTSGQFLRRILQQIISTFPVAV